MYMYMCSTASAALTDAYIQWVCDIQRVECIVNTPSNIQPEGAA